MVMTWNGDKIVDLSRDFLDYQRRCQAHRPCMSPGPAVLRRPRGGDGHAGRTPERSWSPTSTWPPSKGLVGALRLHHRRGHRADALRRQASAHPDTWPWSPSCPCSGRDRPPLRRWPGASTRTSCRKNPFTGRLPVRGRVRWPSWSPPAADHREGLPDLPGVLREAARRARTLGQAGRPPCWAP